MKQKIKNYALFMDKQGFTLVELLVVISIIGLLASFSVVSLNSARIKARDVKRRGDLVQVRTAMNLYYEDNEHYPICGTWDDGEANFGATVDCYTNSLATALTPYMTGLPTDPKNAGIYVFEYVSDALGDEAVLAYETEDPNDASPQVLKIW